MTPRRRHEPADRTARTGAGPGFTAHRDQVQAAAAQLGEPGLPVDDLIRAATWLESFARGEAGYGGLGRPAAGWLAQTAHALLDAAGELAAALAEPGAA